MVCRNLKEIVHEREGAPDTEMGTFPLKKTASPANLTLHVKKCVFSGIRFLSGQIKLAT